ncbi:hypothetical protein GF318_02505 [Candidatus Micrarchaeota archaeon]|nr:hypothetical protein [Candidatus Micrarchaeota archaeon]
MEMSYPQAYLLTIFLETALLYLFLYKKYKPKTIMFNGVLASTLTHPLVWFAFPLLGLSYSLQLAVSELFALVAETGVYAKLLPGISLRTAFFLSLACNAFSFTFGFLLNNFIFL